MPCVSVRNNHARKATVKAANIERKNNRKNTRLAKKQQLASAKAAKIATKDARIQAKTAAKSAKTQAKIDAEARKTRQSLEKRVTKKHQAHRAKSKAIRAKALKSEAKVSARAARAQKLQNSGEKLKASIQKPVKALKSSLETAKTNRKIRQAALKAQKTASIAAKAELKAAKVAAKTAQKAAKTKVQTPQTPSEAARTAKISGAGVQTSLKINHHNANTVTVNNPFAAQKAAKARKTPIYTPEPAIKPLRRTAFMTRDDLINAESRLGSTIFGPVPAGHRREFFHDQASIWIWFESWHDEADRPHQLTVRYEVRTSGVYKKVSAGAYFKLAGDELENFRRATHTYLHLVKKYLYPHVTPAK